MGTSRFAATAEVRTVSSMITDWPPAPVVTAPWLPANTPVFANSSWTTTAPVEPGAPDEGIVVRRKDGVERGELAVCAIDDVVGDVNAFVRRVQCVHLPQGKLAKRLDHPRGEEQLVESVVADVNGASHTVNHHAVLESTPRSPRSSTLSGRPSATPYRLMFPAISLSTIVTVQGVTFEGSVSFSWRSSGAPISSATTSDCCATAALK